MTISSAVWKSIKYLYKKHVLERKPDLNEVRLVCNDIMAELRRMPHSEHPRFEGDQHYVRNCAELVLKVFRDALEMLCDETLAVDTYVVCLDPYGKRRVEKAHTTAERRRQQQARIAKGAPRSLARKPGQCSHFADELPVPCDMNTAFNLDEVRRDLYVYLTESVQRQWFFDRLPEGKTLILSGGMKRLPSGESRPCCPVVVVGGGRGPVAPDPRLEHMQGDVSEGDIDAWAWVHRFPDRSFLVRSGDADLLMIGLMQMRDVISANPKRSGWFCTRRSVGTAEQDRGRVLYAQQQSELYEDATAAGFSKQTAWQLSGGVTNPATRKRVIWKDHYVSMVGLWFEIHREYKLYAKDLHAAKPSSLPSSSSEASPSSSAASSSSSSSSSGLHEWDGVPYEVARTKGVRFADHVEMMNPKNYWPEIRFPVEQFVLVMVVLSERHDYIRRSNFAPRVNTAHCLLAYYLYMDRIGSMLKVQRSSRDPRKKYYTINVNALRRWAVACYHYRARQTIKRGKRTERQHDNAMFSSFRRTLDKNLPSIKRHELLASHCLWVLQYYGNACFPHIELIRGPDPKIDGLPVFGYREDGWAEEVCRGSVRSTFPARYVSDS